VSAAYGPDEKPSKEPSLRQPDDVKQGSGAPESALCPQAEVALQRVEASIRRLRETGDRAHVDRMHYDLAKTREALPEDVLSCPDEMEI